MALTPSTMLSLDTPAPDFSLPTTEDTTVALSDFNKNEALVVMFICNHCPYVIHIKEELIKFGEDHTNKDVGIIAINSNDPNHDPTDSFEHMKKEGYPFPYAFDETQEVAKAYKAACTPDLYVFDKDRKLVYRGQFDASRPGNNEPVTGADLRNAVDAVLAGRELPSEQIPSSGCNIKWKPGNAPEYYG